jgi:hypothetical protein
MGTMLTNRVSLIGYLTILLAMGGIVFQHPLGLTGYWAWFPPTCLLLGIVMSFLGVIARGFERVEKAINDRRP